MSRPRTQDQAQKPIAGRLGHVAVDTGASGVALLNRRHADVSCRRQETAR